MQKIYVDVEDLTTVAKCLEQLANAELAQLDIESQLEQSNCDLRSKWRRSAEAALKIVKGKRRIINAQLAILRQREKEFNVIAHQQHRDFFVDELRKVVSPDDFEACSRAAEARAIEACAGRDFVPYDELETILGETYQVMGVMADALGVFELEDVQKVLDNLSQHKLVHTDILPFKVPDHLRAKLPAGFVAVPLVPTDEMIDAAMNCEDVIFDKDDDDLFCVQHRTIYETMVFAALAGQQHHQNETKQEL